MCSRMATSGSDAYFQVVLLEDYMAIWSPVMNAVHSTHQEHDNTDQDPYAVAVMNDDVTVGHVPRDLCIPNFVLYWKRR